MKLAISTMAFAVISIMLTMMACKKDATSAAPRAAGSETKNAAVPAPGGNQVADVFVPVPEDVQCSVQGMYQLADIGPKGEVSKTRGSVKGITCWIVGSTPKHKRDVPLASTSITDGMLPTKDFGDFQITPTNNIYSSAVGIAVRRSKLQPFREFLQSKWPKLILASEQGRTEAVKLLLTPSLTMAQRP